MTSSFPINVPQSVFGDRVDKKGCELIHSREFGRSGWGDGVTVKLIAGMQETIEVEGKLRP